MNLNKKTEGFTLVELLLVVGLIGVLSGILLTVINPAGTRQKFRDAQRISDLKKVQAALEIYYNDNRTYPVYGGWTVISGVSELSTYMSPSPVDPQSSGTDPCNAATRNYLYRGGTSAYTLVSNMELNSSVGTGACSGIGCGATPNCYMVRSP